MEAFNLLEEKISILLDHVTKLKNEKELLVKENNLLKEQNEALENSLLQNNQNIDDLNTEKSATKMLVDDLIKNIDTLVSSDKSEEVEK